MKFSRGIIAALIVIFGLAGVGHAQIAAPTVTQVITVPLINPAAFTLTSSPNPALNTASVVFSGSVTAPAGGTTPTGTVTVCDGGTGVACTGGISVATVPLSPTGGYTCSETGMTAGSHIITAHYSGDSTYAASK